MTPFEGARSGGTRCARKALLSVSFALVQPAIAASHQPLEWRVHGSDEVRLETLIRDADSGVSASGACQRLTYPIVVTLNGSIANELLLKVPAAVRFHPHRAAFVVELVGSPPGDALRFDGRSTLIVHGRSYPIDESVQVTKSEGCGDL